MAFTQIKNCTAVSCATSGFQLLEKSSSSHDDYDGLKSAIDKLIIENSKLKKALEGLIVWAGETPGGPEWATPEAKARNRQMFEQALNEACNCFPENYNTQECNGS